METQFEIRTLLEKVHYVELFKYTARKRLWWVCINGILGGGWTIDGIISLSMVILACGLLNIGVALYNYLRPWTAARKVIKQDMRFESNEERCSVTKFSDVIYDESKHQTSITPFDKIEEILVSKHVIALLDVRKMAIILDKNGFIKGTFEEFLPFIQEKCPQAKVIIR